MQTTFQTVDALLSAVVGEGDPSARAAMLGANVSLLTEPVLFGIAERGSQLLKAGEAERALRAFTIGVEAADAADQPRARLTLLLRLADLKGQTGPPGAALDAGERACAAASALVETGHLDALAAVVNASGRVATLAIKEGDVSRGRAVLAEARRVARSVNSTNAELWILRNLFSVTLAAKDALDWQSATEYALEIGRLLSLPAGITPRPGEPPAPDPGVFTDVLRLLTTHAYDAEDFDLSASLARIWRLAAPGDADATRELALSAMRIQQFPEAEALWRELLIGAPDDPSVHANLAGSLSAQKKDAAATAALTRAIELAPGDLTFRRFRVRAKRAGGDLAGAIADLGEMIDICDASLKAALPMDGAPQELSSEPAGAAPQTRIQFERNMSARDALDLALMERAGLHERAADLTRAFADLERVAREADPATAAAALRERSRILSSHNQRDLALAALRDAVARAPGDPASAMALGAMLAERQDDAEAVSVLSRLVLHEDFAGRMVTALTPVVNRSPLGSQARLVRGFAAETARHPAIANEDFSVVLEQDPANAHMFFRRGRVRLMQGNSPEDAEWNASLSARRVLEAAYDFARAATLDPADEDARYSLRWLVDRICTAWQFHGSFRDTTSEATREIFKVFPSLDGALQRFLPALDLASRGEYAQALDQWRPLQHELLELSMPVSACRIDVYIADSLLRQFDVQGTLDHLERAGNLLFLIGQPMSRALADEAAETRRRSSRESGRPVVVLETELANVYGLFAENLPRRIDMLRIDALGRTGDFEKMLQLLNQNPELEQTADPELVHAQFSIAAGLRNAGKADRALALADRINAVITDPNDRRRLMNLRGSIHLGMGDSASAETDFRAALESETTANPAFAPFISLNLTRVLLNQGRFAEAREILEKAKGKVDAATPFERLMYHWLIAETAIGLDEIDPAKAEMETALELAEQLRGGFHDPATRIAWQGRLTELYDLAVYIALKAEDLPLVFDRVERTRARAYLDVMRTGVSATPDSAHELVESLAAARARRDILWQLNETMQLNGTTFVDVELVRALSRAAPDLAIVQRTASGRQVMSPARLDEALTDTNETIARMEARIDAARTAASVAAVGSTLDIRALADVLRAGSGDAPQPNADEGQAVVLVEYFNVRGVLCCLVMRSGESVPSLHLVDAAFDEVAAVASQAAWSDPAGADESWQATLSTLIAPIVERSKPDELLWIVPCGPLHQAPLHAAIVEGVPLIERNPVCYSPSASVLPQCLERSRGTYATAIVFGDSKGDLPFARSESLSVAARFGGQAVVGSAATEAAFGEALEAAGERVDILHLATHGTFDADDALDSGIELAGSGEETTRLTARDIVRGELPVELVTLSACESGRTRVFAGDEPVGLTRAFLSAGAAAVLATLWLTNDLSTRLIVERFYDALTRPAGGKGSRWRKAQALREASTSVRRATVGELLVHPDANVGAIVRDIAAERKLGDSDCPFAAARHWAPFALVGAWT